MCNHFDIITWRIHLPKLTKKEIENDVYAKSIFVHEYIHYCQTLASTIGRVFLIEFVRVSIRTGLYLNFGNNLPKIERQIDLWNSIKYTTKSQLLNTKESKDYFDLIKDLKFVYANEPKIYNNKYDINLPIIRQDLTVINNSIKDFPHIIVFIDPVNFIVPLSDLVVFENMARQVQRKYLIYNNTNDELVKLDSLRSKESSKIYELTNYTCIYDFLSKKILNGEDISKWTITLCQFSLMCKYPGEAIFKMFEMLNLEINKNIHLNDFLNVLRKTEYFVENYNNPPLQEIVNKLINEYGTVIFPHENFELRELIKLLINIVNAINERWSYFSEDLWEIDHLKVWLKSFGCPPIECLDGVINEIFGVNTNEYWHRYLQRIDELMR